MTSKHLSYRQDFIAVYSSIKIMKTAFFSILTILLLAGCDNKESKAQQLQKLSHEQLREQAANIKIRVRNDISRADLVELINQLETFHEINKVVMHEDEADYAKLDASMQALAYLKGRKILDPARNENDMALMLMLRPELKDRIANGMHASDLSQDSAFWSVIYWPQARNLVTRYCDEILQK